MEKIAIYRGVTPTEATIVSGIGIDEAGDRWTTDLSTAEQYAIRDGGGVFRLLVDAGKIEPTATAGTCRLLADRLSNEERMTLAYRKPSESTFINICCKLLIFN